MASLSGLFVGQGSFRILTFGVGTEEKMLSLLLGKVGAVVT